MEFQAFAQNRKGFPKGKTCAEFCAGKIQTRLLLGVVLLVGLRSKTTLFITRVRKVSKKIHYLCNTSSTANAVPLLPLEKVDNVANISFNVDNSI